MADICKRCKQDVQRTGDENNGTIQCGCGYSSWSGWSIGEHADDARKLFWLSFCDGDKPEGQQFLGVCIVEVTGSEANEAALEIMLRFPMAMEGAEWLGAATRKAHEKGCNPGGEIASHEIPDWCDDKALMSAPRHVLMQKDELLRLGIISEDR